MERKLPEEWRLAKLSELVSHPNKDIVDGPFGSNLKASEYVDTGIPIIRLQNIGRNSFLHKNLRYITNEKANELKRHNFSSGDIVITKLGSPLGKACLVPPNINWGIIVADVVRLRSNDNLVLKEYLVRAINSDIGIRQFGPLVKGTTRQRVNLGNIRDLIVPVPPLETQRRIVAILEKAEETQRLRAQADELAEQLPRSVFFEMFGDPLQNSKNWDVRKLKEMGEVKTGNTPPRINSEYYGDYIEWIKSDNINTPHTYLTYSEEMLSEMGAEIGRIAPRNSILVTCIAGSISCIGNAAIADRDVAFNQQINAIIPKEEMDPFFVYYLIIYSKDNIKKFSTHSMKGMISKGLFESIYFICPPSDLQREFGKFAEKIEQIKSSQINAKKRNEELFNSLLQKAFTGELVA